MRQYFWLNVAISVCAIGIIIARLIWPNLKIDAITLGLIIVAILPWLSGLIESAKFPGGWEVKFRDIKTAGEKVIQSAPAAMPVPEPKGFERAPFRFWAQDPNLSLVELRIEIEKRIRALAGRAGLPEDQSLMRLFHRLRQNGVLQDASVSGLQDLVAAGNRAAHGARVEPDVTLWAFEYGPKVVAALDAKLQEFGDVTGRGDR
jgi:hypothetical protein